MTTHSSILTCRILWTDSCSHKELDTTKQLTLPHPSMSKMQHSVSPSASNAEKDTDAHSPWWYLHNIAVTQSLLLLFHILHSRDVFLKLLFFFFFFKWGKQGHHQRDRIKWDHRVKKTNPSLKQINEEDICKVTALIPAICNSLQTAHFLLRSFQSFIQEYRCLAFHLFN